MTESDVVAPSGQQPRRSSPRPVILAALAVAIVTVVSRGLRWWTHPTVFPTGGATMGYDPQPLVRSPEAIGVTFPAVNATEVTEVTLRRATAQLRVNTAEAIVGFWVCRQSPGELPIAGADADAKYCKRLRPFAAGDTFLYGPPGRSDYLIVTLTPTKPGRVVLDGST